MTPCIYISRSPVSHPGELKAICGKKFTHPELVPAWDEGLLPSFKEGMFHPKCESALAQIKVDGEILVYAIREAKHK